jgi:DNA helicase II / ATP-dependent DNA helicase PcrA
VNFFADCSNLFRFRRSTSNIINAAQKVISSSTSNGEIRQKMIPKRSAGLAPRIVATEDGKAEGLLPLLCFAYPIILCTMKNVHLLPPILYVFLILKIAAFAVESIKTMIASGEYKPDRTVAFIYRTNAQSREIEEACVRNNLPYVIFGSATSFYRRQEIKDCLCFLRWMYNGRDRTSMLRSMTTPKRGIGETAIEEFDNYCAAVDRLWGTGDRTAPTPCPFEIFLHLSGYTCREADLKLPPPSEYISTRPLKLFKVFSEKMAKVHNKAMAMSVEKVLDSIINDLEILPHLDKISKSKAEYEERLANVRELLQATEKCIDGPCLGVRNDTSELALSPLGSFLDDIALVTDMADSSVSLNEERLVVNLMTIHASKGKEFDTVFFVGCEEGTIPSSQVRFSFTCNIYCCIC